MGATALTAAQRRGLRVLSELAAMGPTYSRAPSTATLRALESLGYAAWSGGADNCWRITDSGRAALAQGGE